MTKDKTSRMNLKTAPGPGWLVPGGSQATGAIPGNTKVCTQRDAPGLPQAPNDRDSHKVCK